jgi:hypothetical protein
MFIRVHVAVNRNYVQCQFVRKVWCFQEQRERRKLAGLTLKLVFRWGYGAVGLNFFACDSGLETGFRYVNM